MHTTCHITSTQTVSLRKVCSNSTQCSTYFSICIFLSKLQTKIGGFDKENLIVAMTEMFCEGSEYSAALGRRAIAYDPAKYVYEGFVELLALWSMISPSCRSNGFLRSCNVLILPPAS